MEFRFWSADVGGSEILIDRHTAAVGSGVTISGVLVRDLNGSGHSFVGYGVRGIWGKGTFAGGAFSHPDNVTFWADIATPTKKNQGTGTVSFVPNHPDERDKVIVYAAPEGDEIAVYTRGTSQLVAGKARVKLGETFALVANPDVGLTAHVTPIVEPIPIAIELISTRELVVRGPAGSSASFDYIVYGLRVGFDRHPVVQKKEQEASLPEAAAFDTIGAADPELSFSTPLTRFTEMQLASPRSVPLNLDRTDALA